MGERRPITTEEQLREIVGHASGRAATKVRTALSPIHLQWLSCSPLALLATADADGNLDVSPKGDPPGFTHVIDDRTIAIPERPGNRRVDGYVNMLQNPHIGAIFLVPGRKDTLRINGSAQVLSDAPYFDELAAGGKRPILAVEISIDEIFFHCPKAFMRSQLWDRQTWDPDALPSTAHINKAIFADEDLDGLIAHYSDDNYRTLLY